MCHQFFILKMCAATKNKAENHWSRSWMINITSPRSATVQKQPFSLTDKLHNNNDIFIFA